MRIVIAPNTRRIEYMNVNVIVAEPCLSAGIALSWVGSCLVENVLPVETEKVIDRARLLGREALNH